jgi:nucleoside transporter
LLVLSIMMFLEHAVLGTWVPLLQLHLQDLHFSGTEIGSIYGTLAIAAIVSSLFSGHLADRVMPAQWVMLLSHLFGAILLWFVADSTRYETVLILVFLNAMLYMPTMAISNLIVFRHLADREGEFGRVRLWGTASWVVVAAMLGIWLSKPGWLPGSEHASTADSLRFGAILSVVLAAFCLVLPPTPHESSQQRSRLAVFGALGMLRNRSTAVLMLVSFLLSAGTAFCYPFGGLFLRSLGVSDSGVSPLMSIGQVGEIAAFLVLGLALRHLGFKATFLIGVASWAARFAVWSIGGPWPLIVASIGLNGTCFAFVLGLGQMFVDRCAAPDARASAQALHQVATFGIGMWLGNLVAGAAFDFFTHKLPDGTPVTDFTQFYLWPALGAAVCFVIFALFFKTTRPIEARQAPPADLST